MFNRLFIGAGLGVAALVLAGCGGGDGDGGDTTENVSTTAHDAADPQDDPGAYFQAITDATNDVGSYRVDITMEGGGGGGAMQGNSLVVTDGDQQVSRTVMEMPAPSAEGGAGEMTTITTADSIYMQFPPDAGLNEEGQWAVLDPEGEFAAMFGNANQTDMVNTEWLTGLGDDLDVSVADGDEVDGVATQVVSMTVTPEQLASATEDNPLAEAGLQSIGDVDYALTVGEDMLVRELSISAGDMLAVTATMSDYGVDETIDIPDDADTVSFEDLMGGAVPPPSESTG